MRQITKIHRLGDFCIISCGPLTSSSGFGYSKDGISFLEISSDDDQEIGLTGQLTGGHI